MCVNMECVGMVMPLLPKLNLFLACFDRGLCRAVSGDTPNSPLVSLVLFKFLLSSGDSPMLPCWTKEHLAKVLNLESSVAAFSRKEIFDWQTFTNEGGELVIWSWLWNTQELANPTSQLLLYSRAAEYLFRTNFFLA